MLCKGGGLSLMCMSVFTPTDEQLLQNMASMCERRMFLLHLLLQLWTLQARWLPELDNSWLIVAP